MLSIIQNRKMRKFGLNFMIPEDKTYGFDRTQSKYNEVWEEKTYWNMYHCKIVYKSEEAYGLFGEGELNTSIYWTLLPDQIDRLREKIKEAEGVCHYKDVELMQAFTNILTRIFGLNVKVFGYGEPKICIDFINSYMNQKSFYSNLTFLTRQLSEYGLSYIDKMIEKDNRFKLYLQFLAINIALRDHAQEIRNSEDVLPEEVNRIIRLFRS